MLGTSVIMCVVREECVVFISAINVCVNARKGQSLHVVSV